MPRSRIPKGRVPAVLIRLGIAVVIALISIVGYFGAGSANPVTGQTQRVAMSVEQEIALGLAALPRMAAQYGGEDRDQRDQQLVDRVGETLVRAIDSPTPWRFEFHLLADPQTINAFALPGGQVFITRALFDRLQTEGQLAGVLGHEVGHVIERHGAQRMAKQKLAQGLVGAAGVAGDGRSAAQMAAAVGNLVNMSYGRGDELESDEWGVALMVNAGYDPRAMIVVMEILRDAGGGGGKAEFFSTHPDPENRIGKIEDAIGQHYPNGVPDGLVP
ncbi:MAG: M48 family metalloprotease [Phycisphaerales bacterium]|nr:M48 family metalloprotease [Phycisphaerales bacterium]